MSRIAHFLWVVALALPAFGDWTTTTDTYGRQLSTGYGIDTVDHYSGQAYWTHTDYQLLLGQDSHLPISRKVEIGQPGSFSRPMYRMYNLGQLSGAKADNQLCSSIEDDDKKPIFRGLNGENVQFTKHNRFENSPRSFLSKNNWLLTCDTDNSTYPVQLTSPDGLRFYYDDRILNTPVKGQGFPLLITDPNGNYARLTYDSTLDLTIETRFQTLSFSRNGISVDGIDGNLASFEDFGNGYKIKYIEDSYWTIRQRNNVTELCNPLKTCVDFEYDSIKLGNYTPTRRLTKKTYRIPHHGTYSINYEYDYDHGKKSLTVTAEHGDHVREYVYYHDQNSRPLYWKLGNLLNETIYNENKTGKYQEVIYEYEPSKELAAGTGNAQDFNRYAIAPRLTSKITKRWSDATDSGSFKWAGTIEVTHGDFDQFNNPETVSYRYPNQSGGQLFPGITQQTKWAYDFDVHLTGLIARTETADLPYFTAYTYDSHGNPTKINKSGIEETYVYGDFGEHTTHRDAEGNTYNYSNYDFGIPKTVTGPEGYLLSRTVENGFIKSETLYGNRTTYSTFDPFGKLIQYQPAEPGREPIRYHYTFPANGGMVLVEENGGLLKTTRFNGMGLPYTVEVEGTGSATGDAYHYKKQMEYYDDGTLKAESLALEAGVTPSNDQFTRYYQDPVGRRTSINPVDSSRIEFQFNKPFETEMLDGSGVKTIERYRPFGSFGSEKLIERRHPQGNSNPSPALTLSLSYLTNGWLEAVSVGGKHHYYNYNTSNGFLDSVFTPETGLIQYRYNDNGQVIWEKRNSDSPIEYHYDGQGRIVLKEYADATTNINYTYDDISRTQTSTKGAYTWERDFDLDGNLIREYLVHNTNITPPSVINSYPIYSSHTGRSVSGRSLQDRNRRSVSYGNDIESQGYLDWEFLYAYDSKGFLASTTYPDGEVVGYLPNALGRPTQTGPYVNNVQYYPNGSLHSLDYSNGRSVTYSQNQTTGLLETVAIDRGNYWNKSYRYTESGYLNAITDGNNSNNSQFFEYDQLYQLKRVRAGSKTGSILESFQYSPAGDLLNRTSYGEKVTYHYNSQTNRLASVVIDGQTHLLGYTPDGRVTAFGQSDYSYTSDKLLAEFSEPEGSTYRYEYDSDNQKVRVNVDGKLQRYTIHGNGGRLMYEERPDDTSTNFIYLNRQLVATRDTEYDLAYTECDYIENKAKRETLLYHRPVWLRRFDGEPIQYGDCERYGKWNHNYESNSGTWENISSSERRYHTWMNHYDNNGNNKGALYDFLLMKDVKQANGNPVRRYRSSGTRRYYECFQRWRVTRYTYNEHGSVISTQTVKSGEYYTGRRKTWRAWQSKPSFSCGSASLDTSKVSWP